ncbi:MAG TPA: RluA family pseudouridine synthase [Rhizobacter sp.]|nr:RluA family pseudouridine synthase [Rhizobacter sp.]
MTASPHVIHLDDSLLVVDKPAGLPSVPGRAEGLLDCMASRVLAIAPDALVVHRLDMATSGLLLFARGKAMQRQLSEAFAQREVGKRYEAVVAGRMAEDEGTIDLPLIADWPNRPLQKVDLMEGKPSITRFRVMERAAGTTRVELEPLTGRSHQLRVHLLALGHPILGDGLYAPKEVRDRAPRLLLHARQLELAHPVSGQAMRFESPVPF